MTTPEQNGLGRKLNLTFVNSRQTTKGRGEVFDWQDISALLTGEPQELEDREINAGWPLFVPFKMVFDGEGSSTNTTREDGTKTFSRSRKNSLFMDLLVLDIDNANDKGQSSLTFDEAIERFSGFAVAIYTSYNHQNPNKGQVDKFRVVIPLLNPVPLEEVSKRRAALKELFPFADPAGFTASQPFYRPMVHPTRASLHRTYAGSGAWFDLLALPPTIEQPRIESSQSYTKLDEAFPDVRLANGRSMPANDLFDMMLEGYDHRLPCYKVGVSDAHPGCFVVKYPDKLIVHNNDDTRTVIQIAVAEAQPLVLKKKNKVEATPESNTESNLKRDIIRLRDIQEETKASLVTYDEGEVAVENLNVRYLPKDLLVNAGEASITLIKSPKGTGKTKALELFIETAKEKHESVLVITHRQFLTRNLTKRLGLSNYQEYADNEELRQQGYLGICINSLPKLRDSADILRSYDHIIIDECEQVLQSLISDNLKRDLSNIFNTFIELLDLSKQIICLDADLSYELTSYLIAEMCPRKQKDGSNFSVKFNDYKIGEDQQVNRYLSRWHLYGEAISAIVSGSKVFVACNGIKFATAMNAHIVELGFKTLLITSATNTLQPVMDFIQDPSAESEKYDVVIASPTLSTGVSIDGNHFDKVFGFFTLNPGTYQDIDQALSRVRSCSDVNVWIQANVSEIKARSKASYIREARDREIGTRMKMPNEFVPELTEGEEAWLNIYGSISKAVRVWSIYKDIQFDEARRALGFTINIIPANVALSKKAEADYKLYKDADTGRAKQIFLAPIIDAQEHYKLSVKQSLTDEEHLMVTRYRMGELLNNPLTLEIVEQLEHENALSRVNKYNLARLKSSDQVLEMDRRERKKNKNTITANHHRSKVQDLLRKVTDTVKIDVDEIRTSSIKNKEYEIPQSLLKDVAKVVDSDLDEFNLYFGMRIQEPMNDMNLVKVWNATLGAQLALPIIKKKRGPKAARVMKFFIDVDNVELTLAAISKEKAFQDDVLASMKRKPM